MASDGLRSLRGDPFLAQFAAEEGFDVQRFVSAVVNDIDPALAKVQRGVERVNEQLRAEVGASSLVGRDSPRATFFSPRWSNTSPRCCCNLHTLPCSKMRCVRPRRVWRASRVRQTVWALPSACLWPR